MRRLLLSFLLVAPVAASAQSVVLKINGADRAVVGGSVDACSTQVTVSYTTNVFACDDFRIWLTPSSCGDAPAAGELVIRQVSPSELNVNRSGNAPFTVSQLPMFKDAACPRADAAETNKVCAAVKTPTQFGECQATPQKDTLDVHYDSKPPATPVLRAVQPRDRGLGVEVDLADDVFAFRIEASVAGEGNWTSSGLLTVGTTPQIGGLENNILYDVRVVAEDEVGNLTPPSGVLQGTPVESCGFPCQFGEASFNGGCSSAPGGFAFAPALVALWFSRRRKQ